MKLFKNGLIELAYDPASDILSVDMPSVKQVILPEVKEALRLIVDHLRHYYITNLLVDASRTEVDIEEEVYTALIADFSRELQTTSLKRVARIVTESGVRENVVKKVYGDATITLEFKSFTDYNSALDWLKN